MSAEMPEPVDRADTVYADGSHTYWSTHCRHDRHRDCKATVLVGAAAYGPGDQAIRKTPAQCKTCTAPCICPCHEAPRVEVAPPREPTAAEVWAKHEERTRSAVRMVNRRLADALDREAGL